MQQTDYIHLQNLIMSAIEGIAKNPDADARGGKYGEMIDFLETMYLNAVMSLVGALLSVAKVSSDPAEVDQILSTVRDLMSEPHNSFDKKIGATYHRLITELNLPDAFQPTSNNQKIVDEMLEKENHES